MESAPLPPAKPKKSLWGISCGSGEATKPPNLDINKEDFLTYNQKLMLHGIGRNKR